MAARAPRYRAGKVPDYAKDAMSDDEENPIPKPAPKRVIEEPIALGTKPRRPTFEAEVISTTKGEESNEDLAPRHRKIESDDEGQDSDEDLRRRPRHQDESEEEEEEDEEVDRRRLRLKRQLEEEEEELMAVENEEEQEQESEESSEYETDSEEELENFVRPMFVPKAFRDTIKEQEEKSKEEEELEELKKKREEERKQETRKLLATEVQKLLHKEQEDSKRPDEKADNEDDQEEEFNLWKEREKARIRRDREERQRRILEQQEIERRRNMTDEEIMRENPEKYKKELKKMKFQQKYYHKGAFFNDDDQISQTLKQRDFSLPTGEDKLDKTVLPKVLQVKNFGRSGRTKYTHLKDQDTTVADSPWAQDTKIRKKFEEKLGGLKPDSYLTKRKRDDRD